MWKWSELEPWKIFVVCVGVIIVLTITSWGLGWLNLPFGKTSVQNVETQWEWAYSMEEDLKASAQQVCNARRSLVQETDVNAKVQWRSHVVAREDNYARIASDYNEKMRNAFETKYIKPDDVRERAPSLENMVEEVCNG